MFSIWGQLDPLNPVSTIYMTLLSTTLTSAHMEQPKNPTHASFVVEPDQKSHQRLYVGGTRKLCPSLVSLIWFGTGSYSQMVQVPNISGLWSENHALHGFWDQGPEILCTWTTARYNHMGIVRSIDSPYPPIGIRKRPPGQSFRKP